MDRLSGISASYCKTENDLAAGDRIAIQMPKSLQFLVACLRYSRRPDLSQYNPLVHPRREMRTSSRTRFAKALILHEPVWPTL